MVLKRSGSLVVYIAFLIFIILSIVYFLTDLHKDFTTDRNEQLKNKSYILGEWISDSFKSSEYLLLNIIDRVPLEHIEYPPSNMDRYYEYKNAIEKSMLSFPYAAFSGIIDKHGILSHTTSVDGFDLSNEDFYREMKNHPDKRSILSNVFKSPEGYYYIIHGLDYALDVSGFDAMAVIGVSLDFFSEWIKKIDYEGSGHISIVDENGILLAHNHAEEQAVGQKFPIFVPELLDNTQLDFQILSINSSEGPGKNLVAFRKIIDRPFYIIIEEEDSTFSMLFFPVTMVLLGFAVMAGLATVVLRSHLSMITIHSEMEIKSSQLETLFNHSMVGIVLVDGSRRILHANMRFAEIAGFNSPEETLGRDLLEMHISKERYEQFGNYYLEDLPQGKTVDTEFKFKRKDGIHVWLRSFGKAIDSAVPPDLSKGVIWILDDVTERREAREKLHELATTDPMTGINNRRHFTELANREFSIYERYGRPVSVLMFDIDHFKTVNDTYGHNAGDEALIHFTEICKQNLRTGDILGRFGGEEFAAVLPATDIEAAYQVAERIRLKTETASIAHPDGKIHFTVSAGVAAVDSKPSKLADSLYHADIALYAAKNTGRNKVVIYSTDKTPE